MSQVLIFWFNSRGSCSKWTKEAVTWVRETGMSGAVYLFYSNRLFITKQKHRMVEVWGWEGGGVETSQKWHKKVTWRMENIHYSTLFTPADLSIAFICILIVYKNIQNRSLWDLSARTWRSLSGLKSLPFKKKKLMSS